MSKATRVILGVISGLFLIFAVGMLVAFIALVWLPGTHRSADGFVTSDAVNLATDGYAITSQEIDLGPIPDEWLPSNVLGTFRVEADSTNGPVFVGIGPSDEVGAYLADISLGIVTEFGPWRSVEITEQIGSAAPATPESVDFWAVSSTGDGLQSVDWEAESGEWTAVVMNAEASSGVDVTMSIGVDTPWLPFGLVATAVLALITGGVGVVLLVLALRRPKGPTPAEPASTQPAESGS